MRDQAHARRNEWGHGFLRGHRNQPEALPRSSVVQGGQPPVPPLAVLVED